MGILNDDIDVVLALPIDRVNIPWLEGIGFRRIQSTDPLIKYERVKYGWVIRLCQERSIRFSDPSLHWVVTCFKAKRGGSYKRTKTQISTVNEFIDIVNKHQPYERPI